jgi:hypothetical protein
MRRFLIATNREPATARRLPRCRIAGGSDLAWLLEADAVHVSERLRCA